MCSEAASDKSPIRDHGGKGYDWERCKDRTLARCHELLESLDTMLQLGDECHQQLTPHLPTAGDEDSDDEYF